MIVFIVALSIPVAITDGAAMHGHWKSVLINRLVRCREKTLQSELIFQSASCTVHHGTVL